MNPLDPANIMSLATDISNLRSADQAEIDRLREALETVIGLIALGDTESATECACEALKGAKP